MTPYHSVIVGAGISGLSAAFALQQRGADVLVLESSARVGGSMHTVNTPEGFMLDCGPTTVHSDDPRIDEHFAQLGIKDDFILADPVSERRHFLLNGKPEQLPTKLPAVIMTPLLSSWAKVRIFAEPFLPRSPMADESVLAFFTRRLGSEATQRLIDPFISSVYAGDPGQTSMKMAFPGLWEAEQRAGSIVRGMLTKPKPPKAAGAAPRRRAIFFGFKQGMRTWPNAIARSLGPDQLWLNSAVSALTRTANGWQVTVERGGHTEVVETERVILACPAYIAARLVAPLDTSVGSALAGIRYAPMTMIHLGYKREAVTHPLDGVGVLCPSIEKRKVLGILWSSTIFPGCVPPGTVLTTNFIGGMCNANLTKLDNAALIDMAMYENEAILGAHGKPVMAHVSRWSHSISQYLSGHEGRIAEVKRLEAANPGLFLIGGYRDGMSVGKCWQNGVDLINRITGHVEQSVMVAQ